MILMIVTAGLFVGALFALYRHEQQGSETLKVVAKNLKEGTDISYKVFADGKFMEQKQGSIGKDGQLALEISDTTKTKENIKFDIDIEKARIDNMMDVSDPMKIIVGLNTKNRSVTFEGSGFKEFADVLVTAGAQTKQSKTDWSGMLSEKINLGSGSGKSANDMVKLAFQNFNVGSDAAALNQNGTVEVFFGDSNGSSQQKVIDRYGVALMMMTEQLSAVMMQQTEIIGTFFDAKMQMQTQRKLQELQARAHKDYHPSEQVCRFGTFMRSVSSSESNAEYNKRAMNRYMMDNYLGVENSSAAAGLAVSAKARVENFKTTYCDAYDNNGGLRVLCKDLIGPPEPEKRERFNKDVDFTRTLDAKLTVDVDFSDNTLTPDEEDVLTMAQNLYFPQVFEATTPDAVTADPRGHYATRTFAAKMNVAHNSFINIVGMKSSAPVGKPTKNPLPAPPEQMINPRSDVPPVPNNTEDAGWAYMKAMLKEFGIADRNASGSSDDEIHALLGKRPSYYAQMEVLTKKIYQSPSFYTNLYDKPANVERIGVAMDAISIMNQRDRYESLTRREMLTSLLVEEALAPQAEDVNARIFSAMQAPQVATDR